MAIPITLNATFGPPQLQDRVDHVKHAISGVATRATFLELSQYASAVGILLLTWVLISLMSRITNRFRHLREFDGPWIAAYTRLWLCRLLASGDSARLLVDVNQKYGSLARIGPNHLVTDDPELVQRILAARSHYERGPWFDSIRIDPLVTNIVSERNTGKHNHLRHQMSGGYGGREIENLEGDVAERVTEFVGWLDKRISESEGVQTAIDLARPIQYLTIDIITHLCFGYPLGFVKESKDLFNFLRTIETQLPIVQHFSVVLEINSLLRALVKLPILKHLITPSAKDNSGIGVIMGLSREVIDKRYAPGAPTKRDMLGAFKNHGLTADEAETEISISLVAGSDTTATSMRAILLMIISNPSVYRKLQEEIDNMAASGQLDSPVADKQSCQMPYLQACIKEGLRRWPPITQLRERMCPAEGDVYKGKAIPPGTFIGINAWGLQLHPVYGPDAKVFRPERWLEADPERLKAMSRVHELVFGYGNTKCLGIPIAMMNLNKFIVELLRRYDLALADPTRAWKSLCYGIFFQKDFNVIVSRRKAAV
ncbi:putative P450 monooxygenase [Teratosphaeria nubilosa]|uniref:Putative P450 monooxygenase n=1 Tax=Teratosphaeria nubilosa TaxID=161662 RepID=A0A6G1LB59_9PEZI|nr:putative P450 monooxygenase [Teratosphaeria nubilosa]